MAFKLYHSVVTLEAAHDAATIGAMYGHWLPLDLAFFHIHHLSTDAPL